MRARKKTAQMLVLGLGLTLIVTAGAWGCGPEDEDDVAAQQQSLKQREKKLSKRLDRVLSRIDATDEQRRKIHRIKAELLKKAKPLHEQKYVGAEVVRQEWKSASPNRERLLRQVDRQLELMRALAHAAVDSAIEVHGTLTPEQRAEVLELAQKLARMHHRWHGH